MTPHMTVKKLSKKKEERKKTKEADESLIGTFISGGGKTTEESKSLSESNEEELRFSIRMPNKLANLVDVHRKSNVGSVSRNTWILEAIARRLKED